MKTTSMTTTALFAIFVVAACDKKTEDVQDTTTVPDTGADIMPDIPTDTLPDPVVDTDEDIFVDIIEDFPVDEEMDADDGMETDGPGCVAEGPLAVSLTTFDGVSLIADAYFTGVAGAPVVILIHQNPVSYDKDSWPSTFITHLLGLGFNVFNLNRRGATGSGGVATDAFDGDLGRWDARAAVDWLATHPCEPGPIGMVGASNGTTTQVDYSIWAEAEAGYEQPVVQVFLSAGTWTENQHMLADYETILDNHPILWAYPTTEAAWHVPVEALGVTEWTFSEQSTTEHGSFMLTAVPALVTEIGTFLDLYL